MPSKEGANSIRLDEAVIEIGGGLSLNKVRDDLQPKNKYVLSAVAQSTPNVRFGTTIPTVLSTDNENDTYVQTTDGTSTGVVIVTFVFDKTSNVWIKQGQTITLDGNDKHIVRANAIAGVAPTALEIPSPILGDTAKVKLTDGKIEFYSFNAAVWQIDFTFIPTVLDGNNVNFARANATVNVAPTALEIPAPLNGDSATIFLNDNSFEFWQYASGAWTKIKTVAAPTAGTNIYNIDGSLTGARIVTLNGNSFAIQGTGSFLLNTTGGPINIGNDTSTQNINFGTGSGNKNVVVGSNTGTSATEIKGGTGNINLTGNTVERSGGKVIFNNTANTFGTSLKAGNNTANLDLTLPIVDGTAGQVMTTNGAGVLSFTSDINSTYGFATRLTTQTVSPANTYMNIVWGTTIGNSITLANTATPFTITTTGTYRILLNVTHDDNGVVSGSFQQQRITVAGLPVGMTSGEDVATGLRSNMTTEYIGSITAGQTVGGQVNHSTVNGNTISNCTLSIQRIL